MRHATVLKIRAKFTCSGVTCVNAFSSRRHKCWEERHPGLIKEIKEIVDAHSQADPTFRMTRLYRRLSPEPTLKEKP